MKTRVREHAELDEVDGAPVVWTVAQQADISNETPHPELYAADRAVDLAREEVGIRLRDVARGWRRVSARLGRQLEPVVGSAVAVGRLIFARARRIVARTRRTVREFSLRRGRTIMKVDEESRVDSTRLTAKVMQRAVPKSSELKGA